MSSKAKPDKKTTNKSQQPLQLRVIGGQWRSRKLHFPDLPGLRPTPDRVRETLFNWLQNTVPAAQCLDLCAGSGALGIEALSRGAKHCAFVDLAALSCRALQVNLNKLECTTAEVVQFDVIKWLEQTSSNQQQSAKQYDIVFLDPPFGLNLCQNICQLLIEKNLLSSNAFVYVETELSAELSLPWTLHREKTSGQVRYRLYKVT